MFCLIAFRNTLKIIAAKTIKQIISAFMGIIIFGVHLKNYIIFNLVSCKMIIDIHEDMIWVNINLMCIMYKPYVVKCDPWYVCMFWFQIIRNNPHFMQELDPLVILGTFKYGFDAVVIDKVFV